MCTDVRFLIAATAGLTVDLVKWKAVLVEIKPDLNTPTLTLNNNRTSFPLKSGAIDQV